MSSLDDPPHVVEVYVEVDAVDSEGNPVRIPAATPIPVPCSVHYVVTDETAELGQSVRTRARIYARSFPAGAYARLAWDGRVWDVEGDPKRFGRTQAVRHVEVDIVARTPETLPIGV